MTMEEGEENMGVRLHVGGLVRGVQPAELAALIARALPQGTVAPTAEIMRDSTTGIERGFGYVNISPGGQGVKDGVERAISAYNGTRWKGGKIRISLAKGDYMQRLRGEWEEEAARTEEIARKNRDHQNAPSSRKDPLFLRLRKRPGERVILVDPKPVPWETPTRSKAGGEGRGEAGGHRRKRGVLGCRRRVTFPGGGVKTSSTTCRDLWRKHLQEVTAETYAARKRSSVESLVLSEAQRQMSAMDRTDAATPQVLSPASRRKDGDVAEEEEDRDVAGNLPPEEPPAPEGIEFVWDDGKEDEGGGALSRTERNGDELYRVGDRDYDEDNVEQDGEEGVGGSPDADRLEVLKEYGRAKAGNKGDCSGNEKAAVAGDQDLPFRPAVEERSIGRRAVSIREKLSRLGRHHGLEIDDRLAEFLSDGEEDADAVGGTFDYELETAERVSSTTDTKGVESWQEELEGMSERLQAENKRSLKLLAEVLGAPPGDSSAAPSSTADPASSRLEGPETSTQSLRSEKNDQRSPLVTDAVADSIRETKELEKKWRRSGNEEEEDDTLAASNEKTRNAAGGERVRPSKAPEGGASGTQNAAQGSSSGKERFVTHMSTLTDIFKVEDKIGTKKNKEEKEKDKGFKLAPLFDSLGGASSSSGGVVPTPGEGFSFSFGAGGDGETAGSSFAATGVDSSGVEVEPRSKGHAGSLTVGGDNLLQYPQGLDGGDSFVGNEGEKQAMVLWRPLEDMEAVAMRFVRSDKREEVEAAWLEERRALTHDFKRKHKDAVKGRRGFGVRVGGGAKRKRR